MNCPHCKDTGDMLGEGYLDCFYCDAAEILAKNGGAAFPDPGRAQSAKQREKLTETGMTLRDYFAAKAMQAVLQGPPPTKIREEDKGLTGAEFVAQKAYLMADAMLKARSA